MIILAVVATIYCVLLAIYCTQVVIDYYKECGFNLVIFLLWALLITSTGVCIYVVLT